MPYSDLSSLPDYIRAKPVSKQHQWMAVWNSSYSSCMKTGTAKQCESEAFAKANGVIKGAEMGPTGDDLHVSVPLDNLTVGGMGGAGVLSSRVRRRKVIQKYDETTGSWMPEPGSDEDTEIEVLLEKADHRVNYRDSKPGDTELCGTCRFFDADDLECSLVEGTISPVCGCDLWTAPIALGDGTQAYAYREPTFQVFIEASQVFAAADFSKPGWIPFLPKPGKYEHAKYGDVIVTPGQNQDMVASVKNHVYQEHIPIDAEHETKLSGAVGYLRDMKMNEDGSADGFVEWTPRGQKMLSEGSFKYISPEWFTDWRDPATGVVHHNIVAGGAITTRPFYKDKVLGAIVASEAGAEIINKEDTNMAGPSNKPAETPPAEPNPVPTPSPSPTPPAEPGVTAPVTFTEAQVQAKIDEALKAAKPQEPKDFAERLTAAETLAGQEKTAREALEAKLAARDKADRSRRFTETVSGRGGSTDGAPWIGDAAKHVAILDKLADQFGEDDDSIKTYVEQQNAIAAQFKASDIFKEFGSSATPSGGDDPERKIEEMTKALQTAKPTLTHAQAYAEVMETPEAKKLYEQTVNPARRGV